MPASLMKRRTQQERTLISRQKVIEATVSCIQRGGVTNATVSANRIDYLTSLVS